ncbi:hypothetical protein L540_08200 [Bordetella pseudohinzii]|nr:hypothetical protein L540_08200 [Bordetella pseudohinzii]
MDIVTIRKTETVLEAGFVSRQAGITKGMYSMASVLAHKLGNEANGYSFLAAVRIDGDRYAMVAVDKNGILPNSDRIEDLAGTREAMNEFYSLLGRPNIKIYAPPELEFGGEEVTLESLLTGLSRHNQLRPLFFGLSRREVLIFGVTLIMVAVSGVAGKIKYDQWEEAKRLQEKAAKEALESVNSQTGTEHMATALVHPWTTRPTPKEFLSICQPQLTKLPLSVAGWTFSEARCDATGVDALYQRDVGLPITVSHFIQQASVYGPGVSVAFSGDNNIAQIKLPLTFPAGGDDPLLPLEQIRNAIVSHFQSQLVAVNIAAKPSEAQSLPGQSDKPPQPTWLTWTFSAGSQLAPADVLAQFPGNGVRVMAISVAMSDILLTWRIEGEFYAQ